MQLVINILMTTALTLMAGLACQVTVMGYRHFHAGVGVASGAGGYTFIILIVNGWSIIAAAMTAVLVAVLIGILFDNVVLSKLRKFSNNSFEAFLMTLAGWIIAQSLFSLIFGDEIRSALVEPHNEWHLFDGVITTKQLWEMAASIFVTFGLIWCYSKTSFGLIFRGYYSNRELLHNFGIPQSWGTFLTGAIGFFCAGCAGILESIEFGLSPTSGFHIWLVGTVAFIVAGSGSLAGIIFSSILISTLSHMLAYWAGGEWVEASMYFVLISFLLWKPLGFSGRRLKKIEI